MAHLSNVEIFLKVAQLHSFAAAAKQIGMTGPAVSKQIMALEEELGVKLLHRTTRQVTLTDEGAVYFERAKLAMDELRDAAAQIRDLKAIPKGTLRINIPLSFGHLHLLPVISGFAKKYPEVQMDVSLDDRTVDIIADGYDLVIRIGAPQDSSLVIKTLAECPIYVVASPEYLAKHGTPMHPHDLRKHQFVSYSYVGPEWRYRDPAGKTGSVRGESVFRANTAEMMLQAVLDGIGMAVLPGFTVATYVQAGKLVQVLAEYKTDPTRSIVALMPPNRFRATKVKLFLDWLGQACKALPLSNETGNPVCDGSH